MVCALWVVVQAHSTSGERVITKPPRNSVISHWCHLVEDFNTSALDFYGVVETALAQRGIPNSKTSRVEWKEGSVLSAKRALKDTLPQVKHFLLRPA